MTLVKVVVRLAFALGLCLTAVAIGVGRLAPAPAESPAQPTRPARMHYLAVTDYSGEVEKGCRLLDADTGRIVSMTLPGADRLIFARSAPWEDRAGRVQVVGRWMAHNDEDEGMRAVGVARC